MSYLTPSWVVYGRLETIFLFFFVLSSMAAAEGLRTTFPDVFAIIVQFKVFKSEASVWDLPGGREEGPLLLQ